jgi:peptidoglycan lytic transglycosylase
LNLLLEPSAGDFVRETSDRQDGSAERAEYQMTVGKWTTAGLMLACFAGSDEASAQNSRQFTGVAAFYSTDYTGRTARGEHYDPKKFAAAHKTLPFGTRLRVTDARSQRSVTVVVNDRGPFTKGRVLDLSLVAAKALNMMDRGLVKVTAVIE